jgi:L-asparaginase II
MGADWTAAAKATQALAIVPAGAADLFEQREQGAAHDQPRGCGGRGN